MLNSLRLGDRPSTLSESTVSNTELGEFLCPHRVPGRELSEFPLCPVFVCQSELTEMFVELTDLAAELSEALSIVAQCSATPASVDATKWNCKYGCKGTVTTRFALIALVAWQYSFDSTLRKLSVHPQYG